MCNITANFKPLPLPPIIGGLWSHKLSEWKITWVDVVGPEGSEGRRWQLMFTFVYNNELYELFESQLTK